METNKVVLYFETETGNMANVTVNNAKSNLTISEIQTIAATVISDNIFFSNSGDLKTFHHAENVTTIKTLIE